MEATAAQSLVAVIAEGIRLTFEAHTKLVALEKALKEEQPKTYERYLRFLDETKQNPPYRYDFGALARLQETLLRG